MTGKERHGEMNDTRLSDLCFFTECLDPSSTELAALGDLARRGRPDEARRRFAAFVRRTLSPEDYLRGEKEKLAPEAEKIAAVCRRQSAGARRRGVRRRNPAGLHGRSRQRGACRRTGVSTPEKRPNDNRTAKAGRGLHTIRRPALRLMAALKIVQIQVVSFQLMR
jgi:hypothetical protein